MGHSRSDLLAKLFKNGIAYLFMLLTVIVTLLSLVGYLGKLNMYLEVTTNLRHQYYRKIFFILRGAGAIALPIFPMSFWTNESW
jgi:hypothetical protein